MVSNQITGNIGLYYACFHLSTIGWNVMPTARNAAGIDIVAYDSEGVAFRGIQVKTVRGRNAVPLGSTLNKVMGDFWIIVRLPKAGRPGSPQCFVMTPAEVRAGATSNTKEGRVSWWLEAGRFEREEFREAWHRVQQIGHTEPKLIPI